MSDEYGKIHQELPSEHHDPLVRSLHGVIRVCVRILAVLMALVIMWGVADVAYVLFMRLATPPIFLLSVGDIFAIFGAFMVVLIAIEIFINIRLYLGSNTLPIKLVVGTALMAGIETELRERNQRVLIVETSGLDAYAPARRFYRGLGYDEEARIREFYSAGEDKIVFRKDLTGAAHAPHEE